MTWHLAFKSLSKTLLAISQNGHVDLEKTTHLGECEFNHNTNSSFKIFHKRRLQLQRSGTMFEPTEFRNGFVSISLVAFSTTAGELFQKLCEKNLRGLKCETTTHS